MSIAGRFSERADSYSRFRWDYADEAIRAVVAECGLSENSVVADIGSGTGILTRHFVGRVGRVLAIEPSAEMRAIAARQLSGQVQHINGVAEATTLSDNSVDMITVGRALHWFPAVSSRMEFHRILKSEGWLAVFKVPCTDEDLVADLKSIRTQENGWETAHEKTRMQMAPLPFFFGHDDLHILRFPGFIYETWEEFLGRICSFAPAPKAGHPSRPKLERLLQDIFERRATNGVLRLPIATEVTFGRVAETASQTRASMKGRDTDYAHEQIGPDASGDVTGFPREQIENPIVKRFQSIVRRYPDRVAVSDHGNLLTYESLNRTVNRVAHAIIALRGEVEEPIPLILGHDAGAIIGALGVLKARKIYCSLDPSHPRARISEIIRELEASLIVTDSTNAALAAKLGGHHCALILVDKLADALPENNPELASFPSLTGIFYTSGSTGQPKGVQLSQRMIQHRVWLETKASRITADDRISLLFSLSFGASNVDIFSALLNGAALCMYQLKDDGLDGLASWLRREEITHFHIPVAVARHFVNSLHPGEQFPQIRQVVPSGPIFRSDLARFWNCFPNAELVAHMGSSETTMIARMVVNPETDFDGDVVPLGYPVEDKEVLILDEAGTPVPDERFGEIAIRSHYISSGYWRRQDLTEKAFRPDPDGSGRQIYRMGDLGRISAKGYLEYAGRRDQQVKIRGYRVELAEVEAAFYRQEEVQEAAVIARENQAGEKNLVAYVVLKPSRSSTAITRIRSALSTSLPDFMVPGIIVPVSELPRTDNGKLDAVRLPKPGRERPELSMPYVAPRTALETELASLWCSLLDLETVGIHDNFIDLGGHSLMAMQLVSRILSQYAVDLSPRLLIETSTVEGQARVIAQRLPAADDRGLERLLDRVEGLSEQQVEGLLHEGRKE